MDHHISTKITHSGPDNRAHYKVWCSCGENLPNTDSLAAVDKNVNEHLTTAARAPHDYSHSVDTCKACLERSLGF